MQAPRSDDVKRRYLVACPACSASNGINATECWQCEQTLPLGLPVASLSPAGTASAPQDDVTMVTAPASFFPVLRDEPGEPAANDGTTAQPPTFARAWAVPGFGRGDAAGSTQGRWPRVATAWTIAGAASLAMFLDSSPRLNSMPSRLADEVAPVAVGFSASTGRGEWPAPPPAEARAPTTRLTASGAVVPDADEPPAPPPVDAPCTPQVVALGLCAPSRP